MHTEEVLDLAAPGHSLQMPHFDLEGLGTKTWCRAQMLKDMSLCEGQAGGKGTAGSLSLKWLCGLFKPPLFGALGFFMHQMIGIISISQG